MMTEQTAVFGLLNEMDQHCREYAKGIPQQEISRDRWTGIAFDCVDQRYVVHLSDVVENMPVPEMTVIPGIKPWVTGVANIRGDLLTVIDLASFLQIGAVRRGRQARVLVVEHEGVRTGLLVDQIHGMQRFYTEDRYQSDNTELTTVGFVTSVFSNDDGNWQVLDLEQLLIDADFLNAAV